MRSSRPLAPSKGRRALTDIFQEVRERVSALDAARRYGFQPNRAGFICCPFHGEKTPSLKLYPETGGFHCFGCGAGGSAIDFTAQLFGLDAMGAVRQLNADFGLALPLDRQPTRAEKQAARHRMEVAASYKVFEEWRRNFINQLNAAFRAGHMLMITDPDKLTDRDALALRMHSSFEQWADALQHGTPEEQAQIYRERGQIAQWIDKVLRS